MEILHRPLYPVQVYWSRYSVLRRRASKWIINISLDLDALYSALDLRYILIWVGRYLMWSTSLHNLFFLEPKEMMTTCPVVDRLINRFIFCNTFSGVTFSGCPQDISKSISLTKPGSIPRPQTSTRPCATTASPTTRLAGWWSAPGRAASGFIITTPTTPEGGTISWWGTRCPAWRRSTRRGSSRPSTRSIKQWARRAKRPLNLLVRHWT